MGARGEFREISTLRRRKRPSLFLLVDQPTDKQRKETQEHKTASRVLLAMMPDKAFFWPTLTSSTEQAERARESYAQGIVFVVWCLSLFSLKF